MINNTISDIHLAISKIKEAKGYAIYVNQSEQLIVNISNNTIRCDSSYDPQQFSNFTASRINTV